MARWTVQFREQSKRAPCFTLGLALIGAINLTPLSHVDCTRDDAYCLKLLAAARFNPLSIRLIGNLRKLQKLMKSAGHPLILTDFAIPHCRLDDNKFVLKLVLEGNIPITSEPGLKQALETQVEPLIPHLSTGLLNDALGQDYDPCAFQSPALDQNGKLLFGDAVTEHANSNERYTINEMFQPSAIAAMYQLNTPAPKPILTDDVINQILNVDSTRKIELAQFDARTQSYLKAMQQKMNEILKQGAADIIFDCFTKPPNPKRPPKKPPLRFVPTFVSHSSGHFNPSRTGSSSTPVYLKPVGTIGRSKKRRKRRKRESRRMSRHRRKSGRNLIKLWSTLLANRQRVPRASQVTGGHKLGLMSGGQRTTLPSTSRFVPSKR